jgi:Protein of unknown function (DUF1572)
MGNVVGSIAAEYTRYRKLGEGALVQLSDAELCQKPTGEGNSIATLVWHLAGNLESRFTDFLTADGEKPWRDRESEFAARGVGRKEVTDKWNRGWQALFTAIGDLKDSQLDSTVTIRGQPLSVCEALLRSLSHTSFHVGQMVFLAKSIRGAGWEYLTIPPGQSSSYNLNPTMEKAPKDVTRKR